MAVEQGNITPPAPDMLARAVTQEKDKYYQYETAFKQTVDVISPVIEALSEPERISRSTTQIDGVFQEDLWRKELQFAPRFVVQGKQYPLGIRQIVDREGVTKAVIFETGVEHDSVFLGGMYFEPKEQMVPYKISTGFQRNAKGGEARELVELAILVAQEAPKQAEKNGLISHSWMKRRLADINSFVDEAPFEQGFPSAERSTSPFYDLILGDGTRIVARLADEGDLWEAKLNPAVTIPEANVAAWKRASNVIPDYADQPKHIAPIMVSS